MVAEVSLKHRIKRVIYFFPVQLLLLHIKRNYLLLVVWIILFGIITQQFAVKFGLPYLFLFPEYLEEVNFWSFSIFGFSCGGFIMAFNIYSYIMHGFKFPFIATLSRPFFKFSLNNFAIPLLFILVYTYYSCAFQLYKELLPLKQVVINISGFYTGVFSFILLSLVYFFRTNKDVFRISQIERDEYLKNPATRLRNAILRKIPLEDLLDQQGKWLVMTYMVTPFKIGLARDSQHYEGDLLKRVITQNHINASIYEIVMLLSFIFVGTFREIPAFMIPSGASVFLLFTMILMLISAFYSWFKGWTYTLLIVAFLVVNYSSTKFRFLQLENHAYGLNYDTVKSTYNEAELLKFSGEVENIKKDRESTIAILENWKKKNTVYPNRKPKIVIVTTSGGGLRSTLWTFHALQYADSLVGNELMKHTFLMTGSSGGMIGAAYLREVYLQSLLNKDFPYCSDEYRVNAAKDILNPISFCMTTNDLFLRYQKHTVGGRKYIKDRGHAFELQLDKNTGNLLKDKTIAYYKEYEKTASIPMMIFAPTVINDGKRMLISSQNISYLTNNTPGPMVRNAKPLVENIEFARLFRDQSPQDVLFTSVLRMNATFPYVLPSVTLPSSPKIELMDAGIRDNYGITTSIQFIHEFKDWIKENTSGVVLIQVRDNGKVNDVKRVDNNSLVEKLITPLGSFYENLTKIHDYEHDQLMQYAASWSKSRIDFIDLSLQWTEEERISLSWHLTSLEKQQIIRSIHLPENQKSLERLKILLKKDYSTTSANRDGGLNLSVDK